MTRNTFDFRLDGLLDVNTQVALLELPPKLRRRLLNTVSKRVRAMSGRRVRKQQNVDGSAYEPAKSKRKGRRKMLSGLVKNKYLNVTQLSDEQATLGWRNGLQGWIADQHHHGRTQRYTAAMARKASPVNTDDPCTDEQAKRLRRLGFKVRVPRANKRGKPRWQRASVAWIKEHVRFGQAGLLIRTLKNERPGPSSWDIKLPRRDFLGASPTEVAELVELVLKQTLNSPR
ncbi:phage virion morphogenesis protein [uncultured Pseudomonas sp.]|uniref:phage virion morphogenesis protein n=1 Tax=uncultured Pseudomonas sp. TaxID=114707 RepID=UPI0025FBAE25|nr:phage virion morphogenesis protein [uncultured Pseudomonas sp.]